MLNTENSNELLSRLCNHVDEEHASKMRVLVEQEEMNLFVMLKPKISMDGNMYCVSYGENPMEGVFGYGETVMRAIYDWNKEFDRKIERRIK